ncbi:MAG: hypothetical protein HS111_29025 [Kofleriaceae bacterium]|nr:hypothetical protein [Kofleriaceae bacterium]
MGERDAGGPNGSTLDAAAYVLAGRPPELRTHTATLTVAIQAQDRLGNWGRR